ncbi:MAG: hypothetical protein F6K40_29890 [Okeania sp. SIO3I5]|uniref:WD40 repeat domain-containing protein n=1 Tax=Okeania sp. SIO3I5 TaxID=2607805 RepID=UPI0013B88331|nr:hypothetical protein [Okeania sp. SIO3I5]NEQ40230.1 hypothetical protein [Okeania sp. SIO3I5]
MPVQGIIHAVSQLIQTAFQGTANGVAKGWAEAKAKQWSESKKKESSNSTAIVQQTKEQAQWIQAQSQYLKRREEREARLEKLQAEQQHLQAYIAGDQAQRGERALQLKQDELGLQANIAEGKAEREERALQLKQSELQLQADIAAGEAQRGERALQLQEEGLELQANIAALQAQLQERALAIKDEELQDRRELARLQLDLMRELHAETIKVQLTEIETIWDLENWFSKLSRQETEDILRKGQQQYRLLVLASPPDISEDCPQSFHNNLKMEIQSKLKEFLHKNYPFNPETENFSPCPVEFYGDYFKEPISDLRVKQLQKLLAPVPTVVLYCQISDYEVNFHLGHWGLHDDHVSLLPMQAWDWEQAQEKLEEAGFDEKKSLRIIRQIIVMVHKLLAAFVVDLYYLNLDATASYEPRLFELEEEFAREWFPQELVREYIEMLQEVQQRQRDAYEAEFERGEAVSWKCTLSFTGFSDDLYRLVAINVDENKLAGERGDGKITKVWNLQTGKLIGAFDSLRFKGLSEDWQVFYRSNFDMWRNLPMTHTTLSVCGLCAFSLAFSPDGDLLASGGNDNTLKLWHPHTGELLRTLISPHTVSSVAFSPDGQLLASGSWENNIKLWHPHTGELLHTLKGHSDAVFSVAFSADGELLASGSSDKTIKIWHPHTGELLRTLRGHSDLVFSVAFSADRELLASGSYDKTIKIWGSHTGELLRTLEKSASVSSVAFSADGQLLASGYCSINSEDRGKFNSSIVQLWNPHTGESLQSLIAFDSIRSVAFSADGQLLAGGLANNTIKLWDPNTKELLHTLNGHSNPVNSVAFSTNGQLLASADHGGIIKLWYPHAGNRLPANREFPVTSPDRSLLVKPNYDEIRETWNLEIIDAATDKLLETLPAHSGSIEQVIFSEDGNTMVSLGGDLVIKVWRRGEG